MCSCGVLRLGQGRGSSVIQKEGSMCGERESKVDVRFSSCRIA